MIFLLPQSFTLKAHFYGRSPCNVLLNERLQDQALSLPLREDLGEALLDFSAPSDLVNWLNSQS
jgi:hypothetical protein